jgi:SAM-dependent methyltransferase
MNSSEEYIEINKQAWNKKVDVNYNSKFYDVKTFLKTKNSLNKIELDLLGDITGKSILHLQCHFGMDSISLANLGAIVTAVDFSTEAIDKANNLNELTNSNVKFVCCDIYQLKDLLNEKFDIVFTTYGTIGWLPDLNKWAEIIRHFLKPKGKFIFIEFHPVVWMFDNDFNEVFYSYFNKEEIVETLSGTYADKQAEIVTETISWNHPLTDVISNLLKHKIEIKSFLEYDYSPYNCFNDMEEFEKGKFRVKKFGNKIPLVYSLVAEKQ